MMFNIVDDTNNKLNEEPIESKEEAQVLYDIIKEQVPAEIPLQIVEEGEEFDHVYYEWTLCFN